ncbi:hypothetical protein Agub_g14763 [Astrephomene gubernaculifera]|uniref:Uncharacterized protein n=1 Tax=Astrephomene gubernaculifera TaxID=47775 RepID=A0AAD3HTH5_9CHLO|nr:hypothetical protein Agub_g14763 [Astrephomene gubernaculifera]
MAARIQRSLVLAPTIVQQGPLIAAMRRMGVDFGTCKPFPLLEGSAITLDRLNNALPPSTRLGIVVYDDIQTATILYRNTQHGGPGSVGKWSAYKVADNGLVSVDVASALLPERFFSQVVVTMKTAAGDSVDPASVEEMLARLWATPILDFAWPIACLPGATFSLDGRTNLVWNSSLRLPEQAKTFVYARIDDLGRQAFYVAGTSLFGDVRVLSVPQEDIEPLVSIRRGGGFTRWLPGLAIVDTSASTAVMPHVADVANLASAVSQSRHAFVPTINVRYRVMPNADTYYRMVCERVSSEPTKSLPRGIPVPSTDPQTRRDYPPAAQPEPHRTTLAERPTRRFSTT